jgi:mRNA-degrading endonuclease RelE of RelBE toxin-antitoxin system
MTYEIIVTEDVVEKLEKDYRNRKDEFGSQIDKLEDFPDKRGKPLSGKLHGIWQLRFGNSDRIWYRIDEENKQVQVINILSKKQAKRKY